jgi:hypothetical protein
MNCIGRTFITSFSKRRRDFGSFTKRALGIHRSFGLILYGRTARRHQFNLHRIYDQNEKNFSLHRFLLTVRDNPDIFDSTAVRKRRENDAHAEDLIPAIGPLGHSQLERDIEFCSDRNLKVLNLKTWRDRITFHKDERELFRQKRFEEDYPLPFTDIDELIEAGFEILNRYSQYFDTTIRSRGSREWKDMEFVFEALTHYPDFSPRV